ncbi:MAG TPA: Fe-S cluster assembly protein SufD [Hyphomicrobiaceae bacterium]|nr:Fe-S cluster assembly protein SufD [Hyphomicrobiaceae bacterium]
MNVAVMKTKAETALTENFASFADALPGGAIVKEARAKALGRFAANGLPHRRIEEWKYTDLRGVMKETLPLAIGDTTKTTIADVIVAMGALGRIEAPRFVLVNGAYRKELSNLDGLDGVRVVPLADALRDDGVNEILALGEEDRGSDALLAVNSAYVTDGALIDVEAGAKPKQPLLIVHVRAGNTPHLAVGRNQIRVGEGADVTIVEMFVAVPGSVGDGQVNTASQVQVGSNAKVSHIKVTTDLGAVTHLANWLVDLDEDSTYRAFQYTAGVGLARNQVRATFKGEGAKLDISGAFLARKSEHIDTTVFVDHAVPHGESRELFKGVLDGEARGIVQGKVIVRRDAQKSDGKQMAQALMLSETAEFDSKPELEIYADDVACGHGSTSAALDDDLLFYLRARGIPLKEARVLLIHSFIGEAIDKVDNEAIREALMSEAEAWLANSV